MSCQLSGSIVGLKATSSKRAYITHHACQICCSQRPYPSGRPLLTHVSAGDTQALKGRSDSVSVGSLGPGVHKALFEPSSISSRYEVCDFALPTILFGLLLCPWTWDIVFGEIQHYPVNGCLAATCNFRVLAGEDERMSFYSTILNR